MNTSQHIWISHVTCQIRGCCSFRSLQISSNIWANTKYRLICGYVGLFRHWRSNSDFTCHGSIIPAQYSGKRAQHIHKWGLRIVQKSHITYPQCITIPQTSSKFTAQKYIGRICVYVGLVCIIHRPHLRICRDCLPMNEPCTYWNAAAWDLHNV